MTDKITLGILFGGKSDEHQISLMSAKNVIDAIDKNKYNVVLIGIDRKGQWLYCEDAQNYLEHAEDPNLIRLKTNGGQLALVNTNGKNELMNTQSKSSIASLDVAFPLLHGSNGEDGTIQGLLRLAGIPFVGPDVLSSAVCMDKDVSKRLLRDAGLPIGKFLTLRSRDRHKISFQSIKQEIGAPFFVKPANSGSSVGISKIYNEEDFVQKVSEAFQHDTKIVFEEFIRGREIECAVLGNEHPQSALPGEIIPKHDFYSYEAKYIDPDGAYVEVPAKLDASQIGEIKALAIKVFRTLECEGMARVDFFLTDAGEILINEVNTIPGFTSISMYPKAWQKSGISYPALIDKLIELALEKDKLVSDENK